MRQSKAGAPLEGVFVTDNDRVTAGLVAHIREVRILRRTFFDPGLFGEPGWDILLDLFQSDLAQVREPVTSVCLASGVPPTTALRWLKVMELQGLIRRNADPHDARRIFLSLSMEARTAMHALFDAYSDEPIRGQSDP